MCDPEDDEAKGRLETGWDADADSGPLADRLFNDPSAHGDSIPAPRRIEEKIDRTGGPPDFDFEAGLDLTLVC
jgi:hypothetical protein